MVSMASTPWIHDARRNLYWQLRQVNDSLGIPTDSMEVLGVQQPVVVEITA